MKMKAIMIIMMTLVILAIGVMSLSALKSSSAKGEKQKISNFFSKTEIYKSNDKLTNTIMKLDYKDSTYSYQEKYILKPGDDVGYETESKGSFKMNHDTLIFYSEMPENAQLDFGTHELTDVEIAKNKFSYIYPIDEKVDDNQVKIYFDNIAEIQEYKAFTIIDHQLKPIKIIERKELDESKSIKTKTSNFFLFHYLIIEKPKNNQLLITGSRDESFLFDFNKIPYQSFHFYTRVYWGFMDFTGIKFQKTDKTLKRIQSADDKRYQSSGALNLDFIKQ